jgi:hypothetical protein
VFKQAHGATKERGHSSKRSPPQEPAKKAANNAIAKPVLAMMSDDDMLLYRLKHFIRSPDERTRQQAQSLVIWYLRHHDWTGPQRRLVKLICGIPVS